MTVSSEQAKELASSCAEYIDYCVEHPDAYVFSKYGDMSFGGNAPVVVLKSNGRCINMVDYIERGTDASFLREGYLSDLA